MPKIGAPKGQDERPYKTICTICLDDVEKLIAQFNLYGEGKRFTYGCSNPYHNCGTVERDGCTPKRVYTDSAGQAEYAEWLKAKLDERTYSTLDARGKRVYAEPGTHLYDDGAGAIWQHPGLKENCPSLDCSPRVKHSGPHTKFCVLCRSGEHERVDETD